VYACCGRVIGGWGVAWLGGEIRSGRSEDLTFPASHKSHGQESQDTTTHGDARKEGNNAPAGLYVLRLPICDTC
jgi:hypothetical protein